MLWVFSLKFTLEGLACGELYFYSGVVWRKVGESGLFALFLKSKWGISVFRGVQHINMDAKGRMAMPARYRDALKTDESPEMIATIDTQYRCLLIYPLHTWEPIEKQLQDLPALNPNARKLSRLLLGHASELDLDANGRIRIPSVLQDYAQLDKKLVLVGQGKKFELWSEDNWQIECGQAIEDANSGELIMPDEFANLVL